MSSCLGLRPISETVNLGVHTKCGKYTSLRVITGPLLHITGFLSSVLTKSQIPLR